MTDLIDEIASPQETRRTPPSWPTTTRTARSRSWPTSPATASSWPAPPPRCRPPPSSSAASTSWPRRPRCSTPTSACCCPTCRPAAAWPTAAPADKLARYQEMLRDQRPHASRPSPTSTAPPPSRPCPTGSSPRGNAEEIIRRVPDGPRDPLRARPAPGPVPGGGDRPEDDPVERLVHGPRDLQRRRPAGAEAASCPRAITIAHPECPANIREHSDFVGGTEAMITLRRRLRASRPTSWSRPRRT